MKYIPLTPFQKRLFPILSWVVIVGLTAVIITQLLDHQRLGIWPLMLLLAIVLYVNSVQAGRFK